MSFSDMSVLTGVQLSSDRTLYPYSSTSVLRQVLVPMFSLLLKVSQVPIVLIQDPLSLLKYQCPQCYPRLLKYQCAQKRTVFLYSTLSFTQSYSSTHGLIDKTCSILFIVYTNNYFHISK